MARFVQRCRHHDRSETPVDRRTFTSLWLPALMTTALPLGAARAAGQVLNVGTGGAFTSIDPHYHNLTPNNVIAYHLFNRLVGLDGEFRPVPELAESWEPAGELAWVFKLRPNVRFHDGTPFAADDIVFTFDRIPKILNSPASFTQAVKQVARIEIMDPLTIKLHTKNPEPLLPYYLAGAMIVSRKHGQGAQTSDYNSGKAAIGTGPHKLDSVILGDKVVFRRNEDFWGEKPHWETVSYRLIANNASRTAAIQAGDVDIVDQVSTRDVATLQGNPKLTTLAPPGQRLIYLYVDSEREPSPLITDAAGQKLAKNPLKDLRVRRALSLAINREGIRTQIMDGFAAPTGQLMPKGAVGYVDSINPDPYDPAQARKLLAEAGYPNGFGITLNGPNDRYVNDRTIVEAIAQMWTRIGVKTVVATTPALMFFAGGARDEYSIALQGWASDTGEASSNLVQIIASTNPEKGRGAIVRESHFARADIDAVVEKSLATFDPAAREALYREATMMGMKEQAIIPLHHQVNIWAMRKGISLRPRMQEGVRSYEVDPAAT